MLAQLPGGLHPDTMAPGKCVEEILVRPATDRDTDQVSAVLMEAAAWLETRAMPLWRAAELSGERIAAEVAAGAFVVAVMQGEVAGTVKFQQQDPVFWPDAAPGEAAYVHRLAVRRRHAGGAVSRALLNWAAHRTVEMGRPWLRLDCEASRPRLRAVYERYGFRYHSNRQVGPYLVARYQYPVPANF